MASFHSTPSGLRRIARVFQGLRGVPLTPGYYIRGLQPQQRQMLVPVRLRPGRLDGIISFNPFRVATDRASVPGVARSTADPWLLYSRPSASERQMLVPVRLRPGRLDGIISFNPFRVATDRASVPGVARSTADPWLLYSRPSASAEADACPGSTPTGQPGCPHFIQPLQGWDGSRASSGGCAEYR